MWVPRMEEHIRKKSDTSGQKHCFHSSSSKLLRRQAEKEAL